MRIAAIPIATADLDSDGGVIDGCARVHWRGRAMFPAAGDGSGTFVFRRHLRRSLHVYVPKPCFSGACPLVGFYPVAGSFLRSLSWGRGAGRAYLSTPREESSRKDPLAAELGASAREDR